MEFCSTRKIKQRLNECCTVVKSTVTGLECSLSQAAHNCEKPTAALQTEMMRCLIKEQALDYTRSRVSKHLTVVLFTDRFFRTLLIETQKKLISDC